MTKLAESSTTILGKEAMIKGEKPTTLRTWREKNTPGPYVDVNNL